MIPLRALAPHKQPESRPLVWLRDPAQLVREIDYLHPTGDNAAESGVAREASVLLRISLAPEGVVVESREDTERRLSLVGRAHLRRWRALELLRLPSNDDVLAAVTSNSFGSHNRADGKHQETNQCKYRAISASIGIHLTRNVEEANLSKMRNRTVPEMLLSWHASACVMSGPPGCELLQRALLVGDCSQYKKCDECLVAGQRASATVPSNGASTDASYRLGCGWCAGRRRQCVPDLRGMCRSVETHLRNVSQCDQPKGRS